MKGRLITVEGSDGSGKSTNIPILVNALKLHGYDVINTREPGGTPQGEEIRRLLLDVDKPLTPKAELLLFAAARANHIETLIKPAIASGKIVVCDRFSDSSYAYQGAGRGLIREVLELEKFVHNGFEPDYTLFFDIPFATSKKRLSLRSDKQDRLDKEVEEFKERVYEGYHKRFREKSYRMFRIDAAPSLAVVERSVFRWVETIFVSQNPLT